MLQAKELKDLRGVKVAIAGQDIALTGLEKYVNKNGRETFTLLSVGSKFEGDIIGKTADGFELRFKGYIYAKKLIDKPVTDEVKAGKLL
jgi:hypothetical protein